MRSDHMIAEHITNQIWNISCPQMW
jgi:hypothetical protein